LPIVCAVNYRVFAGLSQILNNKRQSL